jgi:hypothetical protein
MKALRFILLALALLLQGGEAVALQPSEPPASCCCEDRCPCPMPPQAPRTPQAPTALQVTAAQAPAQAAPARAPRVEPRPWAGRGLPSEPAPAQLEPRPSPTDPDPPGGRQRLLQTSLLRI